MITKEITKLIKKMIYIDASRYSNTDKRTGVENYSYYLINELFRTHPDDITLISPKKISLPVAQIVIPFSRFWTLIRLSLEVWKNKKIDNLFVPSHVLPIIHPKNSCITIHDVVFKYSPESYSLFSRIYLNWATKFAVKHANNIIVPSEKTREDLIKFYKADKTKIHVIPLGFSANKAHISEDESQKFLHKHKLEKGKYFLCIGRIEYKKNTDNLIKAFMEFAKNNSEIKLVLSGFPGYRGKEMLRGIPADLEERIIRTGYIGETEKNILLKNTLAFIFPSRFEGFGIPLLEAMNAGCPILASDIPTSREIALDNALFFTTEDPDSLVKLMRDITENDDMRVQCTKYHEENLKKYSWSLRASQVYSIIGNPKE